MEDYHITKLNEIYDFWFPNQKYQDYWFSSKYDHYVCEQFYDILIIFQSMDVLDIMELIDKQEENKKYFISIIILLDQFTRNIYRDSDFRINDNKTLSLCLRYNHLHNQLNT